MNGTLAADEIRRLPPALTVVQAAGLLGIETSGGKQQQQKKACKKSHGSWFYAHDVPASGAGRRVSGRGTTRARCPGWEGRRSGPPERRLDGMSLDGGGAHDGGAGDGVAVDLEAQ
jgi:hypothetical protein